MSTIIQSDSAAAIAAPSRIASGGSQHTFRQSLRNALIVTRREVRDSVRDWRIMTPIILLTLVFPLLAQVATGAFTNFFEQNGAAPLTGTFLPLLPMIVGFFPLSISIVIALETFVGEKERRSLEPLLSTPLTNTELYVGKTLAAMIPPLVASYLGIAVYVSGLILGSQQWRPDTSLLALIVSLTTMQALVMVTGAVVVSSQATSTRAANLLASVILIPMSLLVLFEAYTMITNHRDVLWYVLIALIIINILLFVVGARIFNREELLGRQIDEINLRWIGGQFVKSFTGKTHSIGEWYRTSVFPAVRELRLPAIVIGICMIAAFVGGYVIASTHPDMQISAANIGRQSLSSNFRDLSALSSTALNPFSIVTQNIRTLMLATVLASFSFGTLGAAVVMVPFGVLGFVFGQPLVQSLGATPTLIAAVLPHGIIEIPALLIAGAAALRLGMVLLRPQTDRTLSQSFLGSLADCFKIGIGVVLPLLIASALVEAYITPIIVRSVAGG